MKGDTIDMSIGPTTPEEEPGSVQPTEEPQEHDPSEDEPESPGEPQAEEPA